MKKEQFPAAKEDLSRRYRGVALGIEKLRSTVNKDPDLNIEELEGLIEPLSKEYDISEEQFSNFQHAIEEYEKKHRSIKKYREMYPDDKELFTACFGSEPKGRIEVIEGPITLHFRCFDIRDYVVAGYVKDHPLNTTLGESWLEKTAALALYKTKLEDLGTGTVSIENVTWLMEFSQPKDRWESPEEKYERGRVMGERSRLHEEQHQYNRLFKPKDNIKSSSELIDNFIARGEQSQEAVYHLVHNLVKLEKTFFEERMWDEILALYKGSRKSAAQLYVIFS